MSVVLLLLAALMLTFEVVVAVGVAVVEGVVVLVVGVVGVTVAGVANCISTQAFPVDFGPYMTINVFFLQL